MTNNKLTIGILAHVDAGKTTLSESILYQTGELKKLGRVDHKDAFLDNFDLEKSRGITIFSKQALFSLKHYEVTLIDTPGHVDFAADMERTLSVLDYAILVISGTDGVQSHTHTVWQLLKNHHIPTFIFVNKMDLTGTSSTKILLELQDQLHTNCIDFYQREKEALWNDLAVCDEALMEAYIEMSAIECTTIQRAIGNRHVFPVYFGSALKNQGIRVFLEGFTDYVKEQAYPTVFGARVFKISRDQGGNRLTHVKITGGQLSVKAILSNYQLAKSKDVDLWEEKVNEIRIYSGSTYKTCQVADAGTICTLTGLNHTQPGNGLGFEGQWNESVLLPVLSYRIDLPKDTHVYSMLKKLRLLEEEEPHLKVTWNEQPSEISIQVMGEVQAEIFKSTVLERFDVEIGFSKGHLVYRETIGTPVIGRGHFEPLKHYAEVQLLMEPSDVGSGLEVTSSCSEDLLDRHWQRLIMAHLKERQHPGVLTGASMTDMKITLLTGKGHNKHTGGGDFREASFRALRQGLMKAESVLLEPMYKFVLEVPIELLGRGMTDIERLHGRCENPEIGMKNAVIRGHGPVSTLIQYGKEVSAYSKGQGRLSLSFGGYEPCHNQGMVVETTGYDPEKDIANPAGSIFCNKGVSYGVTWDKADDLMHMDSGYMMTEEIDEPLDLTPLHRSKQIDPINDQELEAIFLKTYGKKKETAGHPVTSPTYSKESDQKNHSSTKGKYLLVDGYNIIFDWEELKAIASEDLDLARTRLMDRLCNYQGQTGDVVVVVFDAYKVSGGIGAAMAYNNITVVYTKEAVTADNYIERLVHKIGTDFEVTVATSDVVEQVIILGKGARKLSADGLRVEVEAMESASKVHFEEGKYGKKHRPFGDLLK